MTCSERRACVRPGRRAAAAMARVECYNFVPRSAADALSRLKLLPTRAFQGTDTLPVAAIDALPNEILLMILEHLQDAELLLHVVPRVCRRWKDLALSRDRRLWTDVRIKPANPPAGTPQADPQLHPHAHFLAPRAIMHAPFLRSLHFPGTLDHPVAKVYLFTAFRCSRAVVQELHLDDGNGVRSRVAHLLGDRERASVACMLSRSRSVLRALSLGDALLPELWHRKTNPYLKSRAPGKSHMPRLLRHVAALQHLETLSLRVGDTRRYAGQLVGCGLRLRRLSLAYHCAAGPFDFVLDLLAGSAATLQHLELVPMDTKYYPHISLPDSVLVAVAQCTELRSLDIVFTDMAVVGSMPRLERLGLLLARGWYFYYDSPYAQGVFGNLLAQLVECPVLASLRRLELRGVYNFESLIHAGQDGDWDAHNPQLVSLVFAQLGRVASEATALRLRLGELTPRDMIATMVVPMVRLLTVDLGSDPDLLTLFSERGVICSMGED
ncbi:uncharacterized protein LOC117648179 isoform X2 [Thrips palmi]|uniref:Uncharacterized protein LOC117648179 isoform X2 n=2 Tax=Thrips palmi TaxID=161013 RepID=A0A6P8ZQT0_THRPL|nr:uncharacterized protein LOC117648179 isoform X2 [Thrips palmi]